MRSLISTILIAMALGPLAAFAGVKEHGLDNGLKVLMLEDHKSPIAVFQIWYRVGSVDEPFGRSGLSHLLEHMMFKGTEKHGPKELSKTVMKNGGVDNAFTSKDYTAYYQVLPSDRIGLSLEFESDRMRNLILREAEIISERNVVMEERRLRYEDDPQNSLYEDVVAAAFKVHPYHWPVIGWMPDLAAIEAADLRRHYDRYYCPDNAVIVAVGDIDPDELFGRIKDRFGDIEPCGGSGGMNAVEPPQKGQRRIYLKREAELPYVLALFHTPSLPDEDGYALDVLASVLSGGKSGRFYRSIVYEGRLALDAFAEYGGVNRYPYLFYVGATASPGTDAAALEEALLKEVEALKHAPPSDFELQKAKNQIEASYVMGLDSMSFQAQMIGRFEMAGGWRMMDSYVDRIREVTAADVSRVAAKYLDRDAMTIGILIPEGK